ncbi:MAG: hypothetical protein QM533_03135 [Cytophagales bacterium]|nr:hypothetical protein [Cytophagales bacterium]
MATPNYSFIKRQKDLAKKAKKEEKKQAKLRGDVVSDGDEASDVADVDSSGNGEVTALTKAPVQPA